MKPELANQCARRKANPKSHPEELLWLKVCQRAGRKEHSHYGSRHRNPEQDRYRPEQPSPLQTQFAVPRMEVGAEQREQKNGVKDQNRRPLHPAAHGIRAHRIGGDSDRQSERKQHSLGPRSLIGFAKDEEWRDQNKCQSGQNVRQRERCVRREDFVERRHLRRSGVRGIHERKHASNDRCHRD